MSKARELLDVMEAGKPSKAQVNGLVKAYALKVHSSDQGAPIKTQQRFHTKFQALHKKLSDKYPDVDMFSDTFFDQLLKQAEKYWKSKAMSGAGTDW